jgi:uncharacterized protein (TIGR02452 family)
MSGRLREVARQTVAAVDGGGYRTRTGTWVDIADQVARATDGTWLHLPDEPLTPVGPANPTPLVEVTDEDTLTAGRRLGEGTACLVFASAKNPGGGFLGGAKAQEEDIARACALYACQLRAPDFYAFHRQQGDLRYSDRVIHSPDVPVIRDGDGNLLDEPYTLSFLTSAAPNLGAIRPNQPQYVDDVPAVLRRRALRVLTVAAAHGHRKLVLGAWGCGVFRNDPVVVAGAFAYALGQVDRFDRVTFAILDRLRGTPTRSAFERVFRGGRR